MHWMVLRRPFELARLTGHVLTGIHFSGYRVNQDLEYLSVKMLHPWILS